MQKHIVYIGHHSLGQLECGVENVDVIPHQVTGVRELSHALTDLAFHIDLVLIDVDLLYGTGNCAAIDITNTMKTLMRMADAQCGCIPIAVVAELTDSTLHLREVLGTDINGVFPCGMGITIDDQQIALQSFILGKNHIPKKIQQLLSNERQRKVSTSDGATTLTPRQHQILKLVVTRGASNKTIAKLLSITASTVKLHMTAILKKYGVRSRTQLAVFAHDDIAVN